MEKPRKNSQSNIQWKEQIRTPSLHTNTTQYLKGTGTASNIKPYVTLTDTGIKPKTPKENLKAYKVSSDTHSMVYCKKHPDIVTRLGSSH